jgi:hypothetical protein
MPYKSPAGWLEPVPGRNQFQMATQLFHRQRTCPAIVKVAELAATERPFGALRCRLCGKAD